MVKVLILEDELIVINRIKNKFDQSNKNCLNIYFNYLLLKKTNEGFIKASDKINLLGFDYIFLDKDNQFGTNFHKIFLDLLDKNIQNSLIKNFEDLLLLSKKIFLISGVELNNYNFINKFVKESINFNLITCLKQQNQIETILKNNILTKSGTKFDSFLKNN